MKIRKLKNSLGGEGMTLAGQEIEVSDRRGNELIANGLAEEVKAEKPKKEFKKKDSGKKE